MTDQDGQQQKNYNFLDEYDKLFYYLKDELTPWVYKEQLTDQPSNNRNKIISILGKIFEFFTGYRTLNDKDLDHDYDHNDIIRKVYRRLIYRHGILDHIESISGKHDVNVYLMGKYPDGHFIDDKSDDSGEAGNPPPSEIKSKNYSFLPPKVRAYNLAVTDLFVEKALVYLNRKAKTYSRIAIFCLLLAIILTITTVSVACIRLFFSQSDITTLTLAVPTLWIYFIENAIKGLTFYGLAILSIVYLYRIVRMMIDQAERIKDRRHALRQGRLFVHLKGGIIDVEEMLKAFNWNVTQANAFSEFNPDSQSPLGGLIKEFLNKFKLGTINIQGNSDKI